MHGLCQVIERDTQPAAVQIHVGDADEPMATRSSVLLSTGCQSKDRVGRTDNRPGLSWRQGDSRFRHRRAGAESSSITDTVGRR